MSTETTYHFDTTDREAAVAALLVYIVWRSRDSARFKITPDCWGQVERFTKAAAKRARTLPAFVDRLKPKLCCSTIRPETIRVADTPSAERQFYTLTSIFEVTDHRAVLRLLLRETSWIVLLVRDRLERERAIDAPAAGDPDTDRLLLEG